MSDVKKAEHALEGMRAMKVVSLETDERTTKGQKVYREVQVPDWTARHKYFETVLKLCKQLEKADTSTNVLVLGHDFAEQLRQARERSTEEMKARMVREEEAEDGVMELVRR
jgi:hypothetical protein